MSMLRDSRAGHLQASQQEIEWQTAEYLQCRLGLHHQGAAVRCSAQFLVIIVTERWGDTAVFLPGNSEQKTVGCIRLHQLSTNSNNTHSD
jgi:hypothetical protein